METELVFGNIPGFVQKRAPMFKLPLNQIWKTSRCVVYFISPLEIGMRASFMIFSIRLMLKIF